MALKRKIESKFLNWKNNPDRLPLVVKGLRQCGKTFSVLHFAQQHYKNVVYLNFLRILILRKHSTALSMLIELS